MEEEKQTRVRIYKKTTLKGVIVWKCPNCKEHFYRSAADILYNLKNGYSLENGHCCYCDTTAPNWSLYNDSC